MSGNRVYRAGPSPGSTTMYLRPVIAPDARRLTRLKQRVLEWRIFRRGFWIVVQQRLRQLRKVSYDEIEIAEYAYWWKEANK
jgi:hypothetical protein